MGNGGSFGRINSALNYESLKAVIEIPQCSNKTIAIYAARFPSILDKSFLDFIIGKINEKETYTIVYFHSGIKNRPTLKWVREAYKAIDYNYRKNLSKLYIVHPTIWVRTVKSFARTFVSPKTWSKIEVIQNLTCLDKHIPLSKFRHTIPKAVLEYDGQYFNADVVIQPNFPHFGIAIHDLADRDGRIIVLETCIDYLSQNSDCEGLFRVNANKTKITDKIKTVEETNHLEFENGDAILAAGLLKYFLKELPDSIIPSCYFDRIINDSMERIPEYISSECKDVLRLLSKVSKQPSSKMSPKSLAIVFSPILCFCEDVGKLQCSLPDLLVKIERLILLF